MSFPKHHGIALSRNSWIENLQLERLAQDPSNADLLQAARVWYNTSVGAVRYNVVDGETVTVKTVTDQASLTAALASLQSTLEGQLATATGVSSSIQAALDQEILDRAAGDQAQADALSSAITDEVAARTAAIAVAASNAADAVSTEAITRSAADVTLTNNIATLQGEVNTTQAGAGLDTTGAYIAPVGSNYLDTSASLAQADLLLDVALKTEETARIATAGALQSAINNEAQARSDGDAALQTQIEAWVAAQLQGNANADLAEQAARIAADTALQTEIDTTQASIGLNTDGTFAAISGSSYMDSATTVYGAALALDLNLGRVDAAVATETAARQAEDVILNSAIVAETSARSAADTALQNELNATQTGAGLETTGAYAAPTGTNYLNSAVSLKDADLKLDVALKAENERAVLAESGLQTQISAIEAASGDGAAALKTALNSGRFTLETTTATTEHTVTHGLGSDFIHYTILVKGTDNKWRNDIVPVEIVDSNSFVVSLTEARNLRVVVLDGEQLV